MIIALIGILFITEIGTGELGYSQFLVIPAGVLLTIAMAQRIRGMRSEE
ncbi:MAG: hypothetical protein MK081_13790 [Flavobacteriales bacterium]|nr:hypothetical protein [Flavobacteriales bacterium]